MNEIKVGEAINDKSVRDIFIGVDGGATKCRVRVEDAAGNLLGLGNAGPASIRLSIDGTWHAIIAALNEALIEITRSPLATQISQYKNIALDNPDFRFHLGLGLAGCELPRAREEFLAQKPPQFVTVQLQSDAYTACLGAHDGADGAIIIIGTGMVGMQICGEKTSQIGGWGFPHSDEGSAAWLGMEAIRLTLQWADGRLLASSEDSALFAQILKKFNNDVMQLVIWANAANSSAFAQITPLIIEHAANQNKYAINLFQRAAQEIDRVGAAFATQNLLQDLPILPCVLGGGLAEIITPFLSGSLSSRLAPGKRDAASGAIILLKRNKETQVK